MIWHDTEREATQRAGKILMLYRPSYHSIAIYLTVTDSIPNPGVASLYGLDADLLLSKSSDVPMRSRVTLEEVPRLAHDQRPLLLR